MDDSVRPVYCEGCGRKLKSKRWVYAYDSETGEPKSMELLTCVTPWAFLWGDDCAYMGYVSFVEGHWEWRFGYN